MSLINEFENSGNWLFKYRSYLPLMILPLLFYSLLTPLNHVTLNMLLLIGLTISYIGECLRIYTIAFVPSGTSGRNTKKQIAFSLNKKGIYSTVRHPLYLGNFLIFLGPFIYTGNVYTIFIFILIFWVYYERIMFAEEAFLTEKFGKEYIEWSSKTPAFIPNIMLFSPIKSNFKISKVLLQEYPGIFGIIGIFTIIVAFRNYYYNLIPTLSEYWKIIFIFNIVFYISIRIIKKIFYNR
jgi:protein-S-isoprenylcysteine O-methyltransferase Ste14